MANLAANPANWDQTQPWWNGTAYVCDDAGRLGIRLVMTLISTPNAGDIFNVLFQNFVILVGEENPTLGMYSQSGTLLQSWNLQAVNGPTPTIYTFNGTEGNLYIQAANGTFPTYGADFSFTPIAPPPSKVVITKGPRYATNVVGYILQPTGTGRVLALPGA